MSGARHTPTLSERLRDLGPDNSGFRKIGLEAAATIDRLTAALAEAEAANRLGADCLMTAQERCEEAERKWASWKSECVNTQAQLTAASSRIGELEAGLKPFADYATGAGKMPDDLVITNGSSMAKRQLRMGDCLTARSLLTGGGSNG